MPAKTGVPTPWRLISAAPCGDDQRVDAEDEGERGHHHGAKPHPRPEHRGLPDVHALLAPVLGELDDQDAVLGGHRDQHDEPDLGVEVERQRQRSGCRQTRPSTPTGTDSSTGTGIIQLS